MRPPRRPLHRLIFVSVAASVVAAAGACGDRTGLLVPDQVTGSLDARADVIHRLDAGPPEEDAQEEDALPPLDVIEPVDAPNDCPDAGSTLVYLITEQYDLMSFYPPTAQFRTIGAIKCPVHPATTVNNCPDPANPTPFSMAVDRNGLAYVVYCDGELFNVSTLTAACKPTPYTRGALQGFSDTFGMGFSKDVGDAGETLYIASDEQGSQPSRLAHIDTTSFHIGVVGTFSPQINYAELTGTGAGQLFAFYPTDPANTTAGPTAIGEIDRNTAAIVGQSSFPSLSVGSGWAFAFWGGDFYTFTAPGGTSEVHRYRPSDGSLVQVAHISDTIVGAGVSTCAPQH